VIVAMTLHGRAQRWGSARTHSTDKDAVPVSRTQRLGPDVKRDGGAAGQLTGEVEVEDPMVSCLCLAPRRTRRAANSTSHSGHGAKPGVPDRIYTRFCDCEVHKGLRSSGPSAEMTTQ